MRLRKITFFIICFLTIYSKAIVAQERDSLKAFSEWRSRRVGLFIHWGPSSGKALPESHSHARKSSLNPHGSIEAEVYDSYFKSFNPVHYDPDQWLKLAYAAGMRYTVFVAKHHDGFCMFKTDATDYTIMATPYGKDVAKLFAEACQRNGLALGWQISPKDWKNPDYNVNQDKYNAFYIHLLDDLTTHYGKVSVLWFDGIEPVPLDKWKEVTLAVPPMVYARHPDIMLGVHGAVKEDFLSFETMVGPFDRSKPWEMCEPINPSGWVYNKPMPPYAFRDLLRNLAYTVARDGNYLLDVGPMEDGNLYPPDRDRLNDFAAWMKVNSESIHQTRGGPYRDGAWGGATCKENTVYLFVSDQVGSKLELPMLPAKIQSANRLDGAAVNWKIENDRLVLQFPDRGKKARPYFTLVKLILDRPAFPLPIMDGQVNLASMAKVTTSSVRDNDDSRFGTSLLFDNKGETAFQDNKRDTLTTLLFDLKSSVVVSALSLSEKGQTEGWNHSFKITLSMRNNESESWTTFLDRKGVLGGPPILDFKENKARFVKLDIKKKAGVQLQISELRLFGPL